MRSPDELVDLYRSSGLKVTPQRQAVFGVLHRNVSHPSAEAVHAAVRRDMPAVSLRTVYSVLSELTEMGEIHQLDLGTGSGRFDPNTDGHHHLVCSRCGLVRDVHVDHPEVRPQLVADAGFEISETEIVFRGICSSCRDVSSEVPTTERKAIPCRI